MSALLVFLRHVSPNMIYALGGLVSLLVLASVIVFVLVKLRPDKDYDELIKRVRSWWVMALGFGTAMVVSQSLSIVLLALVSFLALKEYFSIIPTRRVDRRVLLIAYLAIPFQYFWVYDQWYGMFIVFIPVYIFLLLPMTMVVQGETQGFLRSVGTLHWGLMTCVFSISHAAFLLALPHAGNPVAGGPGLLLFLVFLTQFNDIAQYVWGRLFGRHKVAPKVSPKKTVEGLIGGVVTTMATASLIAPYLTPFDTKAALAFGAVIAVSGFIGDVTISALKRDIGIKDSGSMIPGHGGVLDRIDSLTYTAPLFMHLTHYFYY
jgi:phosphatidate cytidylyltransferase